GERANVATIVAVDQPGDALVVSHELTQSTHVELRRVAALSVDAREQLRERVDALSIACVERALLVDAIEIAKVRRPLPERRDEEHVARACERDTRTVVEDRAHVERAYVSRHRAERLEREQRLGRTIRERVVAAAP